MSIDNVLEEAAALARANQLPRPIGDRLEELDKRVAMLTAERDEAKRHAVDSITSLPRDTVYYERLETAINDYLQGKAWFAIAITDTAGLKYANDRHGKTTGDQIIETTGGILKTFPLTRRDLLARIGGDEFGLLFTGPRDRIEEKLNKLREHVKGKQQSLNERRYLPIELCMGVGIVTADYVDQKLQADKSLTAKQIAKLLCNEGNRLTNEDKDRQGIYLRHPELQRYHETKGPSPSLPNA